jgi:hypothetical protein
MKHANALWFSLLGFCLLVTTALGQTTNIPPTNIETIEAQTGSLIIKGFGQGGSVSLGNGTISLQLKETFHEGLHRSFQGLLLEYTDGPYRERAVLDYDELQPLIHSLDYIGSVSHNATTLPGFEALHRTRSGFLVSCLGSQHQNTYRTSVLFDGCPRIVVEPAQLSQLRNILAQGLTALDQLKTPR